MKKLGLIIRTVFTDAQEKYGEQMSAAEEQSRQRHHMKQVRIDTAVANADEQESASITSTSASATTRTEFFNPRSTRQSGYPPTPKKAPTLTIPQATLHTPKRRDHHYHEAHHPLPSPSPSAPIASHNPIVYLPTTKPTACTLCTYPIPIHTSTSTHLNIYCTAWFHRHCLTTWFRGSESRDCSPVCPGCRRQIGVRGFDQSDLQTPLVRSGHEHEHNNACDRHRDADRCHQYIRPMGLGITFEPESPSRDDGMASSCGTNNDNNNNTTSSNNRHNNMNNNTSKSEHPATSPINDTTPVIPRSRVLPAQQQDPTHSTADPEQENDADEDWEDQPVEETDFESE